MLISGPVGKPSYRPRDSLGGTCQILILVVDTSNNFRFMVSLTVVMGLKMYMIQCMDFASVYSFVRRRIDSQYDALSRYLWCTLAAEFPLRLHDILDMGMCPERLEGLRLDGREGFARKTAIAIQLVQEGLRPRDANLRDGEVCARDETLEALGFLKE